METSTEQVTTGRTVVGLFRSWSEAQAAIEDLKAAGFAESQIGLAMEGQTEPSESLEQGGNPTAEGAAKGAVGGGIVGGLLGLLGSLIVPGAVPIVLGGVLAATLTGAGIGAATGGLVGGLMGMGVPEEDARYFDSALRTGGTLVTVNAGPRTKEALAVLQRHRIDFGPGRPPVERRVSSHAAYTGPERRVVAK
jgi:hypothetical protein